MTKMPLLTLLLILVTPTFLGAFETDQFSNREQSIADATAVMNLQVNLAIEESIADWYGPRKEMKVVNRIYNEIGGRTLLEHYSHLQLRETSELRMGNLCQAQSAEAYSAAAVGVSSQ